MLSLIQSNQMEVLSAQLAKMLATPLSNQHLLDTEQVLVQSPGMSTWLRLEVAKHNNIAAALNFPLPSSFIWQLCHQLLPNVPKENAFTKAAMTWKLMDLLPHLLHDSEYQPLKDYLINQQTDITEINVIEPSSNSEYSHNEAVNTPHSNQDPLRLYQLCNRIADIFDQYLVYRPEWISAWENNQPLTELDSKLTLDNNQLWQPKLWRALIDYNHNQLNASRYHRANLHQSLLAALANPATDISQLPSRLFVFGISSMPPQTLEVLHSLAARIDVVMLALSPCQHYWGDIVDPKVRARMALKYSDKKQLSAAWEETLEVGNPILANNGKMGRELLDLLLSLPPENTNFNYDCYVEPQPDTLLHGVQYDILQMETLGQTLGPDPSLYQQIDTRRVLEPLDESITLKSCHSPLREVETLHDHITGLLDQNPDLSPKDIVVMMPDVASYAPFIDAVFGTINSQYYTKGSSQTQRSKQFAIPYAIADRGPAQESPLINSFLTLLNINQSRFGLTEILSILEVPAILRRFELEQDDFDIIKRWLEHANVRWGRDANSRKQLGLPAFSENSWSFGIKRIILGYALADGSSMYQGTLPVSGIEGQSAQALGKLLNFLEAIDIYATAFAQPNKTHEKLATLSQLVDDFYLTEDDEQQQINTVREALSSLGEELESAGHQGELSIEVLKQWFNQTLNDSRVGQRYLAGSVNFCTLMPMRSIPFKVVCLLGMNDGVYPRVQHPVGFDLMAHFGAKKGDRSRRLDDRYLFLEALLSARQQLYVSYIGHSERDNAERIPSMLISELIEFCQMSYLPKHLANNALSIEDIATIEQAVCEQLIQQQPLQPFDSALFTPNSKLQSYHQSWCPPAESHTVDNPFIAPEQQVIDPELFDLTALNEQQAVEVEVSSLLRFYRNPAQYFFNRSLKVDLNLHLSADNNDEPFALDGLDRYKLQSNLIESALKLKPDEQDTELLARLKTSGSLPMAPFNDIILSQYQHDIAPLVERLAYLRDDNISQSKDIDLILDAEYQSQAIKINLVGRIDEVCTKGMLNYRPGTAHGRDLIQCYIRHLCLNAQGVNKFSYLLDMGHFHSFAPITQASATALLSQFIDLFIQGQSQPLLLAPRTAWAYVQTDGDHSEKIAAAQKQWHDEQANTGEGLDPHYQRLFVFPDDFNQHTFGQLVEELLQPMLSIYHKDKLKTLESFVEQEAMAIQASHIGKTLA
ncbi:exodeoxyribonuclease V subunit gamma [Shewanella gaetbuli]|uniref:RecBCD enzyme subunit RecC n=1 Tax=Shewanella gaetbuli TaxID=220752 RepID=A0A9X1ZK03_9GAMM|nr:exodeoxyribonuclease V subunit gamma [Shewanella gaetbuli]MCL1142916.1 exodeoxyribonuclease V subunit gamma [Shewanella gaetbuli]